MLRFSQKQILFVRAALFALLGLVFLISSLSMSGAGRLVFALFGVLDLAWAGWLFRPFWRK